MPQDHSAAALTRYEFDMLYHCDKRVTDRVDLVLAETRSTLELVNARIDTVKREIKISTESRGPKEPPYQGGMRGGEWLNKESKAWYEQQQSEWKPKWDEFLADRERDLAALKGDLNLLNEQHSELTARLEPWTNWQRNWDQLRWAMCEALREMSDAGWHVIGFQIPHQVEGGGNDAGFRVTSFPVPCYLLRRETGGTDRERRPTVPPIAGSSGDRC